jgi:hypothetical protein
MPRWTKLGALACTLWLATAVAGCIVEESPPPPPPPPDTEIGFEPVRTFGQGCGAQLTTWQVTLRDDGSTESGGCGDVLLFGALTPNVTYTFDITGFSGGRVCWQGSCAVPAAFGTRTLGDCSAEINHLCGY